jgi:hypothetical protein
LLILPRIHPEGLIFLFLLGIMLLVVLFLHLPRFSLGGLAFLLHLHLEDLIILAQVAPIKLEAQVILSLLVFKFLLEVNLKLGGNPKLGVITQCMGSISLDYSLNLGIFLSKEINNCLGGNLLKLILLYPLILGKPYPGSMNPTWGQGFQSNAPSQGILPNQPTQVGYLTQNPPPLNLTGPSNYLQTAYGPTGIPTDYLLRITSFLK